MPHRHRPSPRDMTIPLALLLAGSCLSPLTRRTNSASQPASGAKGRARTHTHARISFLNARRTLPARRTWEYPIVGEGGGPREGSRRLSWRPKEGAAGQSYMATSAAQSSQVVSSPPPPQRWPHGAANKGWRSGSAAAVAIAVADTIPKRRTNTKMTP